MKRKEGTNMKQSKRMLALLLSLVLFLPVFREYLMTGMVPRIPTLIVSGFIAVAAILSFFCGLLLDTIKQKNRQDFEFQLQLIEQQKKK